MFEMPEVVAMILGALAPLVIQQLKKLVADKKARFFIALGLSGVIGLVAAAVAGVAFSWGNIIGLISAVFAYSQLAYNTWKSLFVEG